MKAEKRLETLQKKMADMWLQKCNEEKQISDLHNDLFQGTNTLAVFTARSLCADRLQTLRTKLHLKAVAYQVLDHRIPPAIADITLDRLLNLRTESFFRRHIHTPSSKRRSIFEKEK